MSNTKEEQIEHKAEVLEIITDVLYSIQTEKGSHLLTTDLCDDTAEQIIKDLQASGYTLAKQEGEEWISVEDKFPPNRTYVLGFYYNGYDIFGYKHSCFFIGIEKNNDVTHWMALPAPPKK